jgi:nucleolar protein 56
MYLYSNILGTFVFNQNLEIREKIMFSQEESLKYLPLLSTGETIEPETKLLQKFKDIKDLRKDKALFEKYAEKVQMFMLGYLDQYHERNLFLTKVGIRDSIQEDALIIQAVSSLVELNRSINMTAKRLREWYSYAAPEISKSLEDHKVFAQVLLEKKPETLLKDKGIKNSMGKVLASKDMEAIYGQAKLLLDLYVVKEQKEIYLQELMHKNCPNLTAVAGYLTGAKLLDIAGSLRDMVLMPASTIQLLGAEKALFRHMINKNSKSPKHGIIIEHPLIQQVGKKDRGRVARALADKISLAVKLDFFKGEFLGDKLVAQLKEKFKGVTL